ncbi:unnamed protein product [Brassicogethes aeneus]|uniref:snRNA-activating protein complex subunit 4 n=1 Tax=Brassicogethes aeneus TaxID=1431903 RepID=A0A9P0FAH7_BRAAE|nr:unnamed protein product [Brassicogethes aeneus]
MDDEEDVRKLSEFLRNKSKGKKSNLEFERLINSDEDEDEEEESTMDVSMEEIIDDTDKFTIDIDVTKINHQIPPNASLQAEEKIVIENCVDPQLKNLLILNRQKNIQLILFYKKVKDLLFECKLNIEDKLREIQVVEQGIRKANSKKLWRISAPYFKDKDNYPAPPNSDTIRKNRNSELSVYDVYASSKWSQMECEKLVKSVKLNYSLTMQKEVLKELRALEAVEVEGDEGNLRELEFKAKYKAIKDVDDMCPPLYSNEFVDWERISSFFLHGNHTSNECRAFWHIHLHPQINKDNWTMEENMKIVKLVKTYNNQNWDQMALELDTRRSGFSVCLHYMSKLQTKFKKEKFSQKEDAKLLKLVEKYKVGKTIPWSKIRQHFADRKREQLYHRYTYFLNKRVKKTRFEPEEDVLLLILVNKFGRSFTRCAESFPERSASQLKARYNGNLQAKIRKGCFTKDEDMVIMDWVKEHGTKSWGGLVNTVQRARAQIRQRYLVLQKFFQDNPDGSYDDIIRRNHTHWVGEDTSYDQTRYIADMFKDKNIPTLAEIKIIMDAQYTKTRIQQLPTKKTYTHKTSVDAQLVEFFSNSQNNKTTWKAFFSPSISVVTENVEEMLSVLGAKLKIPKKLEEGTNLDALDVQVLRSLRDSKTQQKVGRLLPPNLNSIMGLTSLLLKHKSYQSLGERIFDRLGPQFNSHQENFRYAVEKMPGPLRDKIVHERNLFYSRFTTIFKWPSILSLAEPSRDLLYNKPGEKRRTYARAKPGENKNKRVKLSSEISSMVFDEKDTLVIPLDKLQSFSEACSKQNVKVIVLHKKQNQNNVKIADVKPEEPSCSQSSIQNAVESVDDDFVDLQKLQGFLKKEKIKFEEVDEDI